MLLCLDSSAVLFPKIFSSERAFSSTTNVHHIQLVFSCILTKFCKFCQISSMFFAFRGVNFVFHANLIFFFMPRDNVLRLFCTLSRARSLMVARSLRASLSLRQLSPIWQIKCGTCNVFRQILSWVVAYAGQRLEKALRLLTEDI